MLWKIRGKFQHQLVALLTFGIAIPISIVSGYSVISSTQALTELASKQMQLQGESGAKILNTVLDGVKADISYLKDTPPIQGIIRAKENRGIDPKDRSTYSAWTDRLNIIFASVLNSKRYYYSLRFLDENGNELVRLDRTKGKLRVLQSSELKNFKDYQYFRETAKLKSGEVYVSAITLYRENGKLNIPYTPVIYYSTPIFNQDGNRRGILIATLLSEPLFSIVSEQPLESGNEQAFIVLNQEGYYLHHPNSEKNWGFELGRKDNRVQTDYPQKVAEQLLSGGKGFIQEGTKNFISYQTVSTNENSTLNSLILVYQTPKSVVLAPISSLQAIALGITLISLIIVLFLAIQILQQVVKSATNLIGTISSFSNQVLSNMDEQERIATQQSSSVHQTTVTMDELNASSQKSSQQAESAATGAKQALVRVEAGNKAVMAIMKEMSGLQEKVEAIATQVLHLNQQTQQIITISTVVGDLANQTNMLALNASVEAVRAGEMGKGFAIVATEIRKLADESRKSGGKIGDLVNEIQRAIKATVQVTNEGTKNVERGVKTAQSTAEVFVDITSAMEQVVENSQQIALNSKQQAIAVQQVTEAMAYLSKESADAAQGISETKKGTEQLNQAAKQLQITI